MEALKVSDKGWSKTSTNVFWGELAPCDHVVQIYENDDVFIELLQGYVEGGIDAGDSVVIIATGSHLTQLAERLRKSGVNLLSLEETNQFIPLDAEETLSKFMVNGWPDETLFNHVVDDLIVRAKGSSRQRHVRAFGEMVAVLWAKGQIGATVRLEHLWNKFCENEAFCLFCAYPQSGFTQDAAESVMHICTAHSKMVTSAGKGKTEIFYKPVQQSQAL